MLNSKLISLIRTFSKEEFKSFGDFVQSPFFNREKILTELYDLLKKHFPDFLGKEFEKEMIFKNLFPGKKFNDSVMRNTFSKMLTLAEQFLSVKSFMDDDFQSRLFLLRELKSKRQDKLFVKHHSETAGKVDESSFKDSDYFFNKFLLEELSEEFKKSADSFIPLMNDSKYRSFDHLTDSHIINILKANTSIINSNKNFFGEKYNFIFQEEMENYLNKHPEKLYENVYMNYYFNCFKLFETDDETYFYNLLGIFALKFRELRLIDKKNILTILTNYCYNKINNGELKFIKEQFRLYKLTIEEKIYKGDKTFFPHILFMNIVVCGLEAGEFKWIEGFIKNHNEELKNEHKENIFNFSYALFHYWKKNFDESIKFASEVKTADLSYKHQIKSLYLKIYFDLNEDRPFYSHVDSYKHFVNNDKLLPGENKNYILNYIQLTKKLFDLKNNVNSTETDTQLLKKKILSHKALINKTWLLKKIAERS